MPSAASHGFKISDPDLATITAPDTLGAQVFNQFLHAHASYPQ